MIFKILISIFFTGVLGADCTDLRSRFPQSFLKDHDVYSEEYANAWPQMRYPVLLEENEDCLVIENFRNGVYEDADGVERGKWGPALIDLSRVKSAKLMITVFYIQVGPLKYQAGHGQMYFEFEEGGVLVPEGEISGIIHSFEAFRDKDLPYNAIGGGLKDAYDSVMVLSSPRDSYTRAALRDHGIDVYELRLNPEQIRNLLQNSLKEALDHETLKSRPYHTTRNSCVSNQIRLLNTVLGEEAIPEWHTIFGIKLFRTFSTIAPRKIGPALYKHELVQNHRHLECPDEGLQYVQEVFGDEPEMNRKTALFRALY